MQTFNLAQLFYIMNSVLRALKFFVHSLIGRVSVDSRLLFCQIALNLLSFIIYIYVYTILYYQYYILALIAFDYLGSAAVPNAGTTNLHLDMSDAVNVMVCFDLH